MSLGTKYVNIILKEGLIKYGKTDIFLYFKKVDHENIYNLNVLYLLKDESQYIVFWILIQTLDFFVGVYNV